MTLGIAHWNLNPVFDDIGVTCVPKRDQAVENLRCILVQTRVALRLSANPVGQKLGVLGLHCCLLHRTPPVGSGGSLYRTVDLILRKNGSKFYKKNFTLLISHNRVSPTLEEAAVGEIPQKRQVRPAVPALV